MKNTFIKVLCLGAVLLGLGFSANAQFRQSIFLNGNLPTGSIASSVSDSWSTVPLTYENIGHAAAVGFGGGYRASYRFDVGVGEVAPFAQADLFWNMLKGDWRDKYLDADMKAPSYINVPVMAGVCYFYDELWNDITPYGEFGVGVDLFMITREGLGSNDSYLGVNGGAYYAYKPSFAMSWMIGSGAYFGRHVSLGLSYYGLGKHPVDYTGKTLDKNTVANAQLTANEALGHGRETRTIGSLVLRIGFHF